MCGSVVDEQEGVRCGGLGEPWNGEPRLGAVNEREQALVTRREGRQIGEEVVSKEKEQRIGDLCKEAIVCHQEEASQVFTLIALKVREERETHVDLKLLSKTRTQWRPVAHDNVVNGLRKCQCGIHPLELDEQRVEFRVILRMVF